MIEVWQQTKVSSDQTFHMINENPLYEKRFIKVLKYHEPGLAPVYDADGAYHINMDGNSAYTARFKQVFGYYQLRAAVEGTQGWFHILPSGKKIYKEFYAWCGNFQNSYCAVCDHDNSYFHIDLFGKPIYDEKYKYVGDFRDDIAVVQTQDGFYTHVDTSGKKIHGKHFLDLDVFHKGFARAQDNAGWFHIDKNGVPAYLQRYKMIEPFYNGYARVIDFNDAILIIDEQGELIKNLRKPSRSNLQILSGDIVGYWKTQAIRAAVILQIFDYLPANLKTLKKHTEIKSKNLIRLMRALAELNLVYQMQGIWYCTAPGELLQNNNNQSLAQAALHWGNEHYLCWMDLVTALKTDDGVYDKLFGNKLFDWLDTNKDFLQRYQKAMNSYACHDYSKISKAIDFNKHKIIIDAAGGQGALLQFILREHQHLHGILLERPSVVDNISIPADLSARFTAIGFDLFTDWSKSGDAIFLSRVLHDWNDELSTTILKNAKNALSENGIIYVVEMLLQQDSYNGSLLDLNMLVIAGGKERSIEDMKELLKPLNLQIIDICRLNQVANIIKIKKIGSKS